MVAATRAAVVQYDLVVRWGEQPVDSAAPSGAVVQVNGQFPAPTLFAVAGDEMHVTVRNQLNESTAVHFHGILQRGTPAMDGVPFGTQCPIAPGENFTYRFLADAPGTFWYHAHVENHFVRGFYGALLVRAAPPVESSNELVLMLSDWYHTPMDELMRRMMASKPHVTPMPDSLLVNGLGGAHAARLPVLANSTYRIHIINAATISLFRVMIGEHNVTIVGADADRVVPFATPFVDIDGGQRYEVLLETGDTNGTFDIMVMSMHRATPPTPARAELVVGDGTRKRQHEGHGGGGGGGGGNGGGHVVDVAPTFETQLVGATPGTLPAATRKLNISVQFDVESGQWRINDIAMIVTPPITPLLHSAVDGTAWPKAVHSVPLRRGDVVDITWRNVRDANGESEHHPMHIHGHRFWLLGSGSAGEPAHNLPTSDGALPLTRDTFTLSHGDGWAITRFEADNPGVWLAHCHYSWHMSSGMALYFRYETNSLPFLPADTKRCAVALFEASAQAQMRLARAVACVAAIVAMLR